MKKRVVSTWNVQEGKEYEKGKSVLYSEKGTLLPDNHGAGYVKIWNDDTDDTLFWCWSRSCLNGETAFW